MPSIRWLHLSDLHQGLRGQDMLWPKLRESFFQDLSRLHELVGGWDLVLFTGDLTQKADKAEFEALNRTLEQLWAHFRSLGSNPLLVAIPGNHDLVRPDPVSPEKLTLDEWWTHEPVRRNFWNVRSSQYRKAVNVAFRNWERWWSACPVPRPSLVSAGPIPGDNLVTFEKDGLRLGIAGLNTAWLQLGEGDYSARLDLDLRQIHEPSGGDPVAWRQAHDATLLMTHHPPDALHPLAREVLQGEIAPPGAFLIHLFGHMHEAGTVSVGMGGAAPRRLWQGPSLFGLEHHSNGTMSRSHGYTACKLEIDGDRGSLRFWPRAAARHHAGHLHLVQHPCFSLGADGSIEETFVPTRAPRRPPPPREPVSPLPADPEPSRVEREYLAHQRLVWSSGPAAWGGDSLGGEEAFYHADLYVPLKGFSLHHEVRDGLLARLPVARRDSTPPPSPDPGMETETTSEVALSRVQQAPPVSLLTWVSLPELPRLVLTGHPGSGKTLFLTRLASLLASLCLGREAGPDVERIRGLRRPSGRWPIPVLLDATDLAQAEARNPGPGSILDAVASNLARGSDLGAPPRESVRESMAQGRMLLLIDGLDEIADGNVRSVVLSRIRGLADPDSCPRARVIVTARPARYTGSLVLGPELERVDILPFGAQDISDFCERWSRLRRTDPVNLRAVVQTFEASVGGRGEPPFSGNPLMLTVVCHLAERYRMLPDDRGRLCALLVDHLCNARESGDPARGWSFSAAEKRTLLERLALVMQEDGASHWPLSRVHAMLLDEIPTEEMFRERIASARLEWAGGHTGILRFRHPKEGPVEIRFWHRLLREYLAAARIARETARVESLASNLWALGRLQDPFWEDVIRMLPRALGTAAKAQTFLSGLRHLATRERPFAGRMLGLAGAVVLESGEMLPEGSGAPLLAELCQRFRTDASEWSVADRLLVLECMARLDPARGDPRLSQDSWVEFGASEMALGDERGDLDLYGVPPRDLRIQAFQMGTYPVTVQEHDRFVSAVDRLEAAWWEGAPPTERLCVAQADPVSWRSQLFHPSRPVVGVSFWEARAYLRWREARPVGRGRAKSSASFCLPGEAEWERAARGDRQGVYPWGNEPPRTGESARANHSGARIGHPSPVGAFLQPPTGCQDMAGNVWEWCETLWERPYQRASSVEDSSQLVVRGGAWNEPPIDLRCACRDWRNPSFRSWNLGFRCMRLERPAGQGT